MVLSWIWMLLCYLENSFIRFASYAGCIYTHRKLVFTFFKENWTEENGILPKKTAGPGWPKIEMNCGIHRKTLVCDD